MEPQSIPRTLLVVTVLYVGTAVCRNLEQPRYATAYACEGSTLHIECKEGELIHLIRANYGRFSITICNEHGNTEWSVNCMSPKSLRVLHNRCGSMSNCSVPVTSALFEDPCPGTHKYIEVHYKCMLAATTTTTSRPSPPWLITSQPSVWSTSKLPTLRPVQKLPSTSEPATTTTTSTTSRPTTSSLPTTTKVVPAHPNVVESKGESSDIATEEPAEVVISEATTTPSTSTTTRKSTRKTSTVSSTAVFEYVPSPSVTWFQDNEFVQFCAPASARNLYWNWTQMGEVSAQPCPGGATGYAKWRCGVSETDSSKAAWTPATPDLSQCRSVWLTSLESRVEEGDSIISIANDLSQVTNSKILYGGDMMTTTKIIKKMAQKMSVDIQTFPDQRQREALVAELLQHVVRTGSNLLDNPQHPSWRDLSYREQMRVATSLLIGLEENAFLLADTVVREKTVNQTVKNILLSVRVLETRSVGLEQFPSPAAWEQWTASRDWLQLPRGALLENSEGGLVRLVFVAFDRLEEILQPPPPHLSEEDSSTTIVGENGEITSGPRSSRNTTRILNSKVISASLGKGRHIQLSEPVRISLRHLRTENVSNPACVFWDYTMSAWSEEGCHVETTNKTHTMCECDHLTNFAVLMDVHSTFLSPPHQMALQIITYVGCIISIVCLVLAIITFQLFRGLKSDRTTIHKNLCVCLLVAEVLFLAGIGQTDKPIVCGIVAGLLHFFFLCAFAWMFLEGFQLYVMLIEVFEAEKSRIRWYYIFAYGAPLIIVAVSCVVDPFSYGTERYCWLRADNFFIFSFVGPVIAVILANLVFLSMAIYMMCRHANASVSMKSKEHSRLASARAWLRGAIVLVFLLGLTWTFGLLYLNEESIIMAYIFTVLNSLQGLFIFVFHCVQNEKVRKEYRKFIRRNSWLPKCLRCSKHSSSKDRRSSFYAGSNGNPSAPNSHSTDSSALSPHGTSYILQRGWSSRSSRAKPSLGPGLNRASHRASSRTATSNPSDQEVENISFKSYSRDSGHGGSEQEDSPRSHNTTTLNSLNNLRSLNNTKDARRQPYMPPDYHQGITNDLSVADCSVVDSECISEYCRDRLSVTGDITHQQQQPLHHHHHQQQHGRVPKKSNTNLLRSTSPWNHTYTEIRDGHPHGPPHVPCEDDPDPVYEEIERSEIQVSDMSDEDVKRQSDMSRQSSRSYSDHRPLIPYSPANDRNLQNCIDSAFKHKLKDHRFHHADPTLAIHDLCEDVGDGLDICRLPASEGLRLSPHCESKYRSMLDSSRHQLSPKSYMYPSDNARTVAVLDGETVVCHIQPEHEMYGQDSYNSRTAVLPPYSEC